MCLAVPMKVLEIKGNSGTVEISGVRRAVDLSMVLPVEVGQYVIVHAGFALSVTNEEEAKKTLALFEEMAEKTAAIDEVDRK